MTENKNDFFKNYKLNNEDQEEFSYAEKSLKIIGESIADEISSSKLDMNTTIVPMKLDGQVVYTVCITVPERYLPDFYKSIKPKETKNIGLLVAILATPRLQKKLESMGNDSHAPKHPFNGTGKVLN